MDLYENIRAQNEVEYGTKFADWAPNILTKQYSERTHFIYELLQNAEDALATNVWFKLYKDKLIFEHDGKKEFDINDIKGICGVGNSSKDSNDTIGKFGIGFKSVFAYTNAPKIITMNWSFEIKDQIKPYGITERLKNKNTKFNIPFNMNEPNQEDSFNEISYALKNELMADSILFLENIKNINLEIEGDSNYYPTTKNIIKKDENIQIIELNDGDKHTKVQYIIFNKPIQRNSIDKIANKYVKVAYKFKENIKQIVKTDYKNIYVFFATAQESHLNFNIHAPFNTTPARDNINSIKTDKYNKMLSDKIADLVEESLIWLRNQKLITINFCSNIMPIDSDLHDVLKPTYNKVYSMFENNEKLIPTNDGSYESIDNIVLPEALNLVPVFTNSIINLIKKKDNLIWAQKEIALNANDKFSLYLRENFEVTRLNLEQILKGLTSAILMEQSDEWLISLFELIAPSKNRTYRFLSYANLNLKKVPLIRLKNGRHTTIAKNKIYLNNGKIKESILDNNIGMNFYKNILEIPYLDEKHIILDQVLRKYLPIADECNVSFEENIKDIQRIKESINKRELIKSDIENHKFLLATDCNNKEVWANPIDIYLTVAYSGENFLKVLLNGIDGIFFISERYVGIFEQEFFISIGVRNEIPFSFDGGLNSQIKTNRGCHYKTSLKAENYKFDFRFNIKILRMIINYKMSIEKSYEIYALAKKYDYMIADIVDWNSRQDFSELAEEKGYKQIFSNFGWILNNSKWIYGKDGKVYMPIEVNVSNIRDEYKNKSKDVISKLGFKGKESIEMQKAIENLKDGPKKRVIEMMSDEDAEMWLKMKEKEHNYKQIDKLDLETALALQNNMRTNKIDISYDEEMTSVKNKERRASKLERQFCDSMGVNVSINKKLSYTCINSNDEERRFLKKEYKGKCQICGKIIKSYNNKIHFISRNVIRSCDLADEYKNVDYTGWNSLCLCPNCAAEYLYGEKDLSTFSKQIDKIDVEECSNKLIGLEIILQGAKKIIQYSPKHFLALKTAFKIFSKSQ